MRLFTLFGGFKMASTLWSIGCVVTILLASHGSAQSIDPQPGRPVTRDPCSFFICNNGGSCIAPADRPYCICAPGFTGRNCDDRIITRDPCRFFICNNGGTCTAPADRPYCICAPGFTGPNCDVRIITRDPCRFFPCNNGGTCTAPADRPYCICAPGFTGPNCDVRIITRDPCRFFICNNGGSCIAPADRPYCICAPGFTGTNCNDRISNPGDKPGTCPVITDGSVGVCGGIFCRIDSQCPGDQKCCDSACGGKLCTRVGGIIFNPCDGFVCQNGGSCTAPADAPMCMCPDGFVGPRCEFPQNPNEKPGTCPVVEPGSGGICGGTFCAVDAQCPGAEKCCSSPCGNKLCTPIGDIIFDPCAGFVCQNGGSCTAPADAPMCICPARFVGPRCEFFDDPPLEKPGTCPVVVPGSVGICGGTFCTVDGQCPGAEKCCDSACGNKLCTPVGGVIFNPCGGFSCQNGGSCTAPADAPMCICPDGFVGPRCEFFHDPPMEKPGTCPAVKPDSIGICGGIFCTVDGQCPGDQKCCDSPCGSKLCTSVELPPAPLTPTCATVRCAADTVCRIVLPCETCPLPVARCIPRDILGPEPDAVCQRHRYLDALYFEDNNSAYSLVSCTPGSCPNMYVCVEEGACCTGKPDPTEKPGTCPLVSISICGGTFCDFDSDCPGDEKCCDSSCGGKLCTRADPPLPPPILTCATVLCVAGTVCREVLPCETCLQPQPRCFDPKFLGPDPDGICIKNRYLEALFFDDKFSNYKRLQCTPGSCPDNYVCVSDPIEGSACCTGRPDPTEKPGTCPVGGISVCGGIFCSFDSNCPGDQKCCDSSCGGKLCTEVEPPRPPSLTCANIFCIFGTVCRMVLSCETCTDLYPRCIDPEHLGPRPDADCTNQGYLEALYYVRGTSDYNLYKCRGPNVHGRCPQGYVCVYDQREGGTCCTGKPDPYVEKPGKCPEGGLSVCGGIFCDNDYDCPGEQKCCPGCGNLCTTPVTGEICGNSVCDEGEVCVQKQPVCPPGFACIQALIPTCVPEGCADCAFNEDCEEVTEEPALKQRIQPACRGRYYSNLLCRIFNDDDDDDDEKSYRCVSRDPCGPEPCPPGQECRLTTVCPEMDTDTDEPLPLLPCRQVYECQPVDECGGCPDNQKCIEDTDIVCKKAPCNFFRCVPDDSCNGCPKGEVCIDTGIRCVTTPCPTYQCVPDNECGGCPKGQKCELLFPPCAPPPDCDELRAINPDAECIIPRCDPIPTCIEDDPPGDECGGCPKDQMCVYNPDIVCITTPCPPYECVPVDECGGCPSGQKCELLYPPCPPPPDCDALRALDPNAVCIIPKCEPIPRCVQDDPPVDECGGCRKGFVCIDTGIRCITTPCDTYQCVVRNECGGCPSGQKCELLYPPCPPPPNCDELRELDPNAECIIPKCEPIPTCVRDNPPVDNCGGCPFGKVCIYTGIQCVTTPCPTYQCVDNNECGGCPDGKKCELLPTPCPAPTDCDEILLRDPTADCVVPRCDPVPVCVDIYVGPGQEEPSVVRPTPPEEPHCPLRCPPNTECRRKRSDCSSGLCPLIQMYECVSLKTQPRNCPPVSRTYSSRSVMCIVEQNFKTNCRNERDCHDPDEMCCPSICGGRVCENVRRNDRSILG